MLEHGPYRGYSPEVEKKDELERNYREVEHKFGERFFGIKQVEDALTTKDGEKLVEFDEEQRERVLKELAEFMSNEKVASFIENISKKKQVKEGWHIRLQVSGFKNDNPINFDSMGKSLDEETAEKIGLYPKEDKRFSRTREREIRRLGDFAGDLEFCWVIGTIGPVKSTTGTEWTGGPIHPYHEHGAILKECAGKEGLPELDDENLYKPKPVELIYRSLLVRNGGLSTLKYKKHNDLAGFRTPGSEYLSIIYHGYDSDKDEGHTGFNSVSQAYGSQGSSFNLRSSDLKKQIGYNQV